MKYKKTIFDYLTDEQCLQYIVNILEEEDNSFQRINDLEKDCIKDQLWGAFVWANTPQGNEYWVKIEKKLP